MYFQQFDSEDYDETPIPLNSAAGYSGKDEYDDDG